MPNKPLTLPNLIRMQKIDSGVYEDLVTMQQQVNLITQNLGGVVAPVAQGGINVTAANGTVDVQITDKHPEVGEQYFLNYDTQPSFATAHDVPLGPVRNYRTTALAGLTTYWRWYKSTQLGGRSDYVVFGSPATAVVAGNLSTTSPGPTPSPAQGSGQSQIPGYGYGSQSNNSPSSTGRNVR